MIGDPGFQSGAASGHSMGSFLAAVGLCSGPMNARTADELERLLAAHPEASPSVFLEDGALCAWLYDHLTIGQLKAAFQRDADPELCHRWRLSAIEYKEQVAMALAARQAAVQP